MSGSWRTPYGHRPVVWQSWIGNATDARMGMGTARMGMGNHGASPAAGAGNAGLVVRVVGLLTRHIHVAAYVVATQDVSCESHTPFGGVEDCRVSEVLLTPTVEGRCLDTVGMRYTNVPKGGEVDMHVRVRSLFKVYCKTLQNCGRDRGRKFVGTLQLHIVQVRSHIV